MMNQTKKQNSNLIIYICLIFLLVLNIITFFNKQKPMPNTVSISGENSTVKAGITIGVVDIKKIQTTAQITSSVNNQRDKYIKELKDKSENLKTSLKKKEEELKAQSKTLSQKVLQEKVIELQKEIRENEMELASQAQKIQLSYAQAVQKIQTQHLNPILESVAKDKGFDILTTNQDSVIINKNLDVTDEVIKELNKKSSDIKMTNPSEIKIKK